MHQISRRGFLYGTAALAGTGIIGAPLSVVLPESPTGYNDQYIAAWSPIAWSPTGRGKVALRDVTGVCDPGPLIDNLYEHHSGRKGLRMRPHPWLSPTWPSVYSNLAGTAPPPIKQRPAIIEALGLPQNARIRTVLNAVGDDLVHRPRFQQLTAATDPACDGHEADRGGVPRVHPAPALAARAGLVPQPAHHGDDMDPTVSAARRAGGAPAVLRAHARLCGVRRQRCRPTVNVPMGQATMEAAIHLAIAAGLFLAAAASGLPAAITGAQALAAVAAGETIGFFSMTLSLAAITFVGANLAAAGTVATIGVTMFANQFLPIQNGVPAAPNTYTGYQAEVMSDTPTVNDTGFQGGTTTISFGSISRRRGRLGWRRPERQRFLPRRRGAGAVMHLRDWGWWDWGWARWLALIVLGYLGVYAVVLVVVGGPPVSNPCGRSRHSSRSRRPVS